MSRLEAGDKHFTLASSDPSTHPGEEQKTWYLFERETLEKMGGRMWERDEEAGKRNYLLHSVRFKLYKKISPKITKITGAQSETLGAIQNALLQ